jgi:hypothetical protein
MMGSKAPAQFAGNPLVTAILLSTAQVPTPAAPVISVTAQTMCAVHQKVIAIHKRFAMALTQFAQLTLKHRATRPAAALKATAISLRCAMERQPRAPPIPSKRAPLFAAPRTELVMWQRRATDPQSPALPTSMLMSAPLAAILGAFVMWLKLAKVDPTAPQMASSRQHSCAEIHQTCAMHLNSAVALAPIVPTICPTPAPTSAALLLTADATLLSFALERQMHAPSIPSKTRTINAGHKMVDAILLRIALVTAPHAPKTHSRTAVTRAGPLQATVTLRRRAAALLAPAPLMF